MIVSNGKMTRCENESLACLNKLDLQMLQTNVRVVSNSDITIVAK